MRFCVQAQHEGGSRTEEFQINQKGIQETGRYEPFRESDAYLLFLGSDSDGLPGLEDTDESNQWLCKQCKTFSTVNEAITFLEQLHR